MIRPYTKLFLLPATLCLLLGACANTGASVGQLAEMQERDRQVIDLRLSQVEERLDGVERGLNEVRTSLAEQVASRQTAARSTRQARQAKRSDSHLAASPVVIGTKSLNDVPVPAPIPYLPRPDMLDLSGVGPQGSVDRGAPAPAPGSAPAPSLEPAKLAPAPAGASAPRSAAQPARTRSAGNADYDKALALYNKGSYEQAGQAFAAFTGSFPTSPLAANALYWQGECSYSQGKYDEAIILFKDVTAKYPKHAKAAASLLKAGYAYERMKDMENARFYWQILIDDYPGSAPAALARKKMASQS